MSGELSVERFSYNDSVQFTNIFTLELPHDFELDSIYMIFSSDKANLIVYNSNGSILRYKLKLTTDMVENVSIYKPCTKVHEIVDEHTILNCLSLEQQKQLELENHRKIQVQQRKAEILEIIAKLKHEFVAIKNENTKLPGKFQLDAREFEIDKRITDDLEWRTQQKFKTIQAELLKKIDKIRTQAERMEQIYLEHLEHWPITITGFRFVVTFCNYK